MCDMMHIYQNMVKSIGLPKFGNLWDQGELDWAVGTTVCQSCPKNLGQMFEILLHPVSPLESPKVMGLTGIHHPNDTPSFQWGNPLPVMWEGRAKWRNYHQPFEVDALQVGPGV